MTIDDKNRHEKLQYNINIKLERYQHCYQVQMINTSILQVMNSASNSK